MDTDTIAHPGTFVPEGTSFRPTEFAVGPWSRDQCVWGAPRLVRRGAPEPGAVRPGRRAMDILNPVIGLHEALGVEIPGADGGRCATHDGCLDCLAPRPGAGGTEARRG